MISAHFHKCFDNLSLIINTASPISNFDKVIVPTVKLAEWNFSKYFLCWHFEKWFKNFSLYLKIFVSVSLFDLSLIQLWTLDKIFIFSTVKKCVDVSRSSSLLSYDAQVKERPKMTDSVSNIVVWNFLSMKHGLLRNFLVEF